MPACVLEPSHASCESPTIGGQRVRTSLQPAVQISAGNIMYTTHFHRSLLQSTARYIAVVRFHSDVGGASKVQKVCH